MFSIVKTGLNRKGIQQGDSIFITVLCKKNALARVLFL